MAEPYQKISIYSPTVKYAGQTYIYSLISFNAKDVVVSIFTCVVFGLDNALGGAIVVFFTVS